MRRLGMRLALGGVARARSERVRPLNWRRARLTRRSVVFHGTYQNSRRTGLLG